MLGPTVNGVVIIVCSLAGCFLVRGIPSRFEEIIKKAIGLSVFFVGIKGAFDNQRVLLLILSLVLGAALGELINIDALMNRLGAWAERKLGMGGVPAGGSSAPGGVASSGGVAPGVFFGSGGGGGVSVTGAEKSNAADSGRSFSKGFVTASILFCTGSMAIVGSMQSGLMGNHEILYAKSILDGVISIVFAASMGIGVAFSAVPVFIYQAGIALASMAVKELLTPDIVREMSAVGSLLVASIGFNFLGVKEIKVANLIPAIFIPLVYMSVEKLF